MRQMGISTDDVVDPVNVKTKFPTKSQTTPSASMSPKRVEAVDEAVVKKRGYHSYVEELRETVNVAPMAQPTITRAAPPSNAREQFLKSLGIDNMDVPLQPQLQQTQQQSVSSSAAAAAAAGAPSRASQEFARPSAAAAAHSSHDSAEDGPGPRSFMAKPTPDITLGLRKPQSKAKSVDGEHGGHSLGAHPADRELDALTVEEIKTLGNKAFEEGDFRRSIRLYTRALERDTRNAALYSNRSACYLQAAKQMGIDTRLMALRDAEKTIELRPDWFKGYSRKGDALFKLERFPEAAVAYERGLALDPTNTNLMHSLGEARNAAGSIQHTRSASWSTQPQSVDSLRKAQGKSAHDLMEEMRESLRNEAKECVAIGNDYRAQQLQKFREQQTSSKSGRGSSDRSTSRLSARDDTEDDEFSRGGGGGDGSHPRSSSRLDSVREDETFGSRAAAAYQQSLLEQYRRKKATAAASSFTH